MIQLLGLLLLPAVGIITLVVRCAFNLRMSEEKIVSVTTISTVAVFFLGILFGFQGFSIPLINSISFSFAIGLNGISIPFMLLAAILPALGLWSAHKEIKQNKTLFYVLYLLAYMSLITVFMSTNLLSLFIFWEVVLVAFFFIIAFWGEKETKRKASMKFLIFTQFGSLTLLGAFILLFLYTGSFNLYTIESSLSAIPTYIQQIIFLFVLITAIIKMPVFPLHSWLPDAHTSAPTAGSVLLAGVLLKLGAYVFILFGALLLPSVMGTFQLPLIGLGVFTAVYSTLAASAQKDFKRLIAYSSIFYMAFVFIGTASLSTAGETGAILLAVSHGFIVGMLFVLAGTLKEKTGTRNLDKLGGLMSKMPMYAFFLVFAVIATLGVPGLSNFPGELLVLVGAYGVYWISLFALLGVLIATNYYLMSLKKILFVSLGKAFNRIKDISAMDSIQLSLFTVFIVVLGVVPSVIINSFNLAI